MSASQSDPRRRWVVRGRAALVGVVAGLALLPLVQPTSQLLNSDWPSYAIGGRIIASDQPALLYDLGEQQRQQDVVTGGRRLAHDQGLGGLMNYQNPPWFALLTAPFAALGNKVGLRLWILGQLLCLGIGLVLLAGESGRSRVLPGLAAVPAAVMVLNAQTDGLVVLGLGAAWALWLRQRRFLAGLALGLCLVKPQLVLPLAVAVIVARLWPVVAGWATGLVVLGVMTAAREPALLLDWLRFALIRAGHTGTELGLVGLVYPLGLPRTLMLALAVTAIAAAVTLVVALARAHRQDAATAAAILIAGGILAAPHALASDLVLLSASGVVWAGTRWFDWLALSAGALVVAVINQSELGTVLGLLLLGAGLARLSTGEGPLAEQRALAPIPPA